MLEHQEGYLIPTLQSHNLKTQFVFLDNFLDFALSDQNPILLHLNSLP